MYTAALAWKPTSRPPPALAFKNQPGNTSSHLLFIFLLLVFSWTSEARIPHIFWFKSSPALGGCHFRIDFVHWSSREINLTHIYYLISQYFPNILFIPRIIFEWKMGDATKLAFAVFLISCSSGGCGMIITWFIITNYGESESTDKLIVTSAESSA